MSTLKHSKTWPISTMAAVQMRLDSKGKTYSAIINNNKNQLQINEQLPNPVVKMHFLEVPKGHKTYKCCCDKRRDKSVRDIEHHSESIKIDDWDLIYLEKKSDTSDVLR